MTQLLRRWHKAGIIILALAALLAISRTDAVAQAVRAALVRDIDTPALAPFGLFFEHSWTPIQSDVLLTTVPAGKRLVIEHVSYSSYGTAADAISYVAIRKGYYLDNSAIYLQIQPPHSTYPSGHNRQDGSQAVKAYFDAGTEVWLRVLHLNNDSRHISLTLNGYYVTP